MAKVEFSCVEEHYLKRELLRLELNNEFEGLNDALALRRFGHPFTADDPREFARNNNNSSKGLKKLRRISGSSEKKQDEEEEDAEKKAKAQFASEFPVLNHFLRNFVMTFPLLAPEMVRDPLFWQSKVQLFFEHFMSLPFSGSFDREELTKRKKMGLKLSKGILLFYNSGLAVSNEHQYYEEEKYKISNKDSTKATKLNKFSMPTRESLRYLLTNEPVYFNGIDINIVAVVGRHMLFPAEKKHHASSSSFSSSTKHIASRWMKSNLGLDLSKIYYPMDSGASKNKKHHYYFIIRVRKQDPQMEFYMYRPYDEFKKLAKDLKTTYPGKKLPQLPHKNKIKASLKQQERTTRPAPASNHQTDDDPDEIEYEEFDDDGLDSAGTSAAQVNTLPRERMRTSLRQYLRSLCQDKEVATGIPLKKFLFGNTGRIQKEDFSEEIRKDIKNREFVDLTNVERQIEFQKMAFERSLKLQESLKEFKTSLLKDQDVLLDLFREFKEKDSPTDLSPLLRDFFDWCKIYISATVYQLFLGSDSGYELYKQVRRLHKLMPYTIMTQILRFTNPISITKGMMDLFMAQPFGGQSLLQTMFSTILADDLKSQNKVIEELDLLIRNSNEYGYEISTFFKEVVFNDNNRTIIDMDAVHKDVKLTGLPIAIVVTMKGTELGRVSANALAELMESYSHWKKEQQNNVELVEVKSEESLSNSAVTYFTRVKEYFQLLVKERDKRLMRQLWEDPELSQLIKASVALFYDPMIRVFKVARMDIAFRNFESFMDDLIVLLDATIDGNKGSVTATDIVSGINGLINKHEASFYQFAHDIYVNDTQGIFEGIITWLCSILNFLQQSKFGDPKDSLDLGLLVSQSDVNPVLLKDQLSKVIDKRLKSREIYSQLVKSKTERESIKKVTGKPSDENVNDLIDKQWKQLNNAVVLNEAPDFNLNDADLVDLDLDVKDYDYLQSNETDELEQKYKAVLDEQVSITEIEKFLKLTFKPKLNEIFDV